MNCTKSKEKKRRKLDEHDTPCCQRIAWLSCAMAFAALAAQTLQFFDGQDLKKQLTNVQSHTSTVMKTKLDAELDRRFQVLMNNINADQRRRVRRQVTQTKVVEDNTVEPHVEFIDPKLRSDLEAKEETERAKGGASGPSPGESWVWLTSYSRVPEASVSWLCHVFIPQVNALIVGQVYRKYKVVQGFCQATKEYCPPGLQGPAGPTGEQGLRGEKGERGAAGLPGKAGDRGPVGPAGRKGDRGWPGNSGFDGRDGVPGEPGLDGMSGRNGADGAPGKDGANGKDGKDGRPGRDGKNGQDGKPGAVGPIGPRGPPGPKGLTGPKGMRGSDGRDGSPGKNGVTGKGWSGDVDKVLIPPSISPIGRIIAREGEHVRLFCSARGQPAPAIQWRRADDRALPRGAWRDAAVPGPELLITNVTRMQAGPYQCTANNGLTPQDSHTMMLEVYFTPFIRIKHTTLAVFNGSTARIECQVEAWPEPILYWETKVYRPLDGYRFRSEIIPTSETWRWIMKLNVTNVQSQDFTDYFCAAKYENNITMGKIMLTEADPTRVVPGAGELGGGPLEVGKHPPTLVTELSCAACPRCQACADPAWSVADLVEHLIISPFENNTYNGIVNRTTHCVLHAIGKPVYHRFSEQMYGAWMRDAAPPDEEQAEKFWVTVESDSGHLKEYANKSAFRKDQPTKIYTLPNAFYGNAHVVYNGSFFYQEKSSGTGVGGSTVRRFRLLYQKADDVLSLPGGGGGPLYSTAHNELDFSVDDNGLWVIYALKDSNDTAVAKIDFETNKRNPMGLDMMVLPYIWNMTLNHKKVGEMFVVCGVLYALDSTTDRDSRVRLAIDLFRTQLVDVSLNFTNPFKKTTTLSYDHRNKELYSWDRGNQLTYPVRYHGMEETPKSAA